VADDHQKMPDNGAKRMQRRRTPMKATLFICTFWLAASGMASPAWAQEEPPTVPEGRIRAHTLRGGGGWKTDGNRQVASHRWKLQLTRGDNQSVTGRVTLGGSPLASAGNVQGQIAGDAIFGTIADDAGNEFAAFEGTITASGGMSGKYMDRTGETGDWASDGPPPK
jgi:hypothetical protein